MPRPSRRPRVAGRARSHRNVRSGSTQWIKSRQEFQFDGAGKAVRVESGGLVEEFDFDVFGAPLMEEGSDGTVIRSTHDWTTNTHSRTNEQLEAVHGAAATTTTVRDAFDRIVSVTTGSGATTTTHDDASNTYTRTSSTGDQTVHKLNARGQPCSETDVFGIHWRYDYDQAGNFLARVQGVDSLSCTATALPSARTTQFVLDEFGTFLRRIDAMGQVTEARYDAHGRLDELEEPEHTQGAPRRVTDVDFDAEGQNTGVTPPGRSDHAFTYTPLGDLLSYSPPDVSGVSGVASTYQHNREQQLTGRIEPDALFDARHYDGVRGDLERIGTVRGDYVYEYDPQGNATGQLHRTTTPEGDVLTYLYDPLYQGTLRTGYQWTGTINADVAWTYAFDQRVQSTMVNDAHVAPLTYDADRFLVGAGALTLTRGHPTHSRVTATTLPGLVSSNQVATTHNYSAFGELALDAHTWEASPLYSVSYAGYDPTTNPDPSLGQRDALGRIVRKVERTEGGAESVYEYAYTAGGALREVRIDGVLAEAYSYDENGNRLADLATAGITYDDQDRIVQHGTTTYSHTARGSLASKNAAGQETTYDYDVFGNLRMVSLHDNRVIEYVVDAMHRRIGKKVDGVLVQGFLWQDNLRIAAELDGQGNVVARFLYGERPNVPEYMEHDVNGDGAMDVRYRFVLDHVGSVRMLVNVDTGTVVQRTDYDSFGKVLSHFAEPGFSQPFGFAGGLYDEDTGLVRFGARDYDAEVGRWTARDPILFEGDQANLYAYVLNDPIGLRDPRGTDIEGDCEKKCDNLWRQPISDCFSPSGLNALTIGGALGAFSGALFSCTPCLAAGIGFGFFRAGLAVGEEATVFGCMQRCRRDGP